MRKSPALALMLFCIGPMACNESTAPAPAALDENAATLIITSEPPGASVVVDGKAEGETPQTIRMRSGQHTLVVRKSGYFTVSEKLFMGPRREVTKNVTLVGSH